MTRRTLNVERPCHGTSVSIDGNGVLIVGESGTGKSSLAIELIARGAKLVSDDLTRITTQGRDWPILSCPSDRTGQIEARGIGILHVPSCPSTPLSLIVDLDEVETARLPEHRSCRVDGFDIPLIRRVDTPGFPASIYLMVAGGRS